MSEYPLTALRDAHQASFQAWCDRNPDKAREHDVAFQRWADSVTEPEAARMGQRWQAWEIERLTSSEPLVEVAFAVQRTYSACRQALYRHRKAHGIKIYKVKGEHDPYGDTECSGGDAHGEMMEVRKR